MRFFATTDWTHWILPFAVEFKTDDDDFFGILALNVGPFSVGMEWGAEV
jgi:hypothetical protein